MGRSKFTSLVKFYEGGGEGSGEEGVADMFFEGNFSGD
jgi:hypothetical protein